MSLYLLVRQSASLLTSVPLKNNRSPTKEKTNMKTLLSLLLSILTLGSSVVFAEDSPMTPIVGADLYCEQEGGMFAFDLENGKEKIWRGDPGVSDGLQLTVTSFERHRCPGCYSANATLTFFGQTIELRFTLSGELQLPGALKQWLKVEARDRDNAPSNFEVLFERLECRRAS